MVEFRSAPGGFDMRTIDTADILAGMISGVGPQNTIVPTFSFVTPAGKTVVLVGTFFLGNDGSLFDSNGQAWPGPVTAISEAGSFTITGINSLAAPDLVNLIVTNTFGPEVFVGNDVFYGSAGNDVLLGYDGNDTFHLDAGGDDRAEGGSGSNTYLFKGAFTTADTVVGQNGASDRIVLDGDYSTKLAFADTTMTGVHFMTLKGGHSYNLQITDANVGTYLEINANTLRAGMTPSI